MLHQNLFDPVPLVGLADQLIPSDCHEDKYHKPYPIVGRHFLAGKEAHIYEVYKHVLFLFFFFLRFFFLFHYT